MEYQPQEIEVWYVIPSIRREIVREMKKLGVSQVKISKIMGLTTGAISQYISGKRANNFKFPQAIQKKIIAASKHIKEEPSDATNEIQKIVQEIRNTGLLCEYHKKYCTTKNGCVICIT